MKENKAKADAAAKALHSMHTAMTQLMRSGEEYYRTIREWNLPGSKCEQVFQIMNRFQALKSYVEISLPDPHVGTIEGNDGPLALLQDSGTVVRLFIKGILIGSATAPKDIAALEAIRDQLNEAD